MGSIIGTVLLAATLASAGNITISVAPEKELVLVDLAAKAGVSKEKYIENKIDSATTQEIADDLQVRALAVLNAWNKANAETKESVEKSLGLK